jgi:hypothetical protein
MDGASNRESYVCHQEYIAQNPFRQELVDSPERFPYCFTYLAERKRGGAKEAAEKFGDGTG